MNEKHYHVLITSKDGERLDIDTDCIICAIHDENRHGVEGRSFMKCNAGIAALVLRSVLSIVDKALNDPSIAAQMVIQKILAKKDKEKDSAPAGTGTPSEVGNR